MRRTKSEDAIEPLRDAIGRALPMPKTLAGWPEGSVYRPRTPVLDPRRVAFEQEVPTSARRKNRPWRGGAITSDTPRG